VAVLSGGAVSVSGLGQGDEIEAIGGEHEARLGQARRREPGLVARAVADDEIGLLKGGDTLRRRLIGGRIFTGGQEALDDHPFAHEALGEPLGGEAQRDELERGLGPLAAWRGGRRLRGRGVAGEPQEREQHRASEGVSVVPGGLFNRSGAAVRAVLGGDSSPRRLLTLAEKILCASRS
jgi:hypothetical protein